MGAPFVPRAAAPSPSFETLTATDALHVSPDPMFRRLYNTDRYPTQPMTGYEFKRSFYVSMWRLGISHLTPSCINQFLFGRARSPSLSQGHFLFYKKSLLELDIHELGDDQRTIKRAQTSRDVIGIYQRRRGAAANLQVHGPRHGIWRNERTHCEPYPSDFPTEPRGDVGNGSGAAVA